MYELPPLNALRAFESAARCGSFVQAGRELGVSAPAVSLQVKALEEHLGKSLFFRKGNRIFLTDSGEAIYPKLAKAFDHLSDITRMTRHDTARAQLVISVLPALSELWLLPKVLRFKQETGVSIKLRVDNDPFDFIKSGADIRITYGSTFYEGYRNLPLFSDVAIPVCSPSFWKQHGDPHGELVNVPDALLIHNDWGRGYSTEPSWPQWAKITRSKKLISNQKELIVSDITLAIAAAKDSHGIALVPKSLVNEHLKSQALISPGNSSLKMKKSYFCIYPNAKAEHRTLQKFLGFINDG